MTTHVQLRSDEDVVRMGYILIFLVCNYCEAKIITIIALTINIYSENCMHVMIIASHDYCIRI